MDIVSKVDEITKDQLHYAQLGLGQDGTTNGWQLFAEDGQMRLYSRELEIDGLVCDPLKAVHVVKGVTAHEMCHRFFNPANRFDWEETLESMKVIDVIDANTLVFHQIHKRIWPAAQRDAVFWSHIRKVDDPKPSCLSQDDINPHTRPDLKLVDVWIVCNNSIDKPEISVEGCVRVKLTVSLVCETYIPIATSPEKVTRDQLVCKIIYSSTINPGGWAPAAILRAVYRREYPRFLENFSKHVIEVNKSKPIAFGE
jgi:collagen type IV alpha-3-binding protein